MLGRINNQIYACQETVNVPLNDLSQRWKRNEKEDIKLAIEYLYEFKAKLDGLHPNALDFIGHLLQKDRL